MRIIALAGLTTIGLAAYFAYLFSKYSTSLKITKNEVNIGNNKYYWHDITSYKIFNTSYFETLTIRLSSGKTVYLTGLDNKRKSLQFHHFKNDFLKQIEVVNRNREKPIIEKSFYKTNTGKIFGLVIILLNLIATYLIVTRKMRLLPVIILFSSSIPILSTIRKK